ncbi:hypothetical protein, partial [Peribacillus frigoritolerans]|uniref:hypothetical protein n=1 Tax=Peribacillus frigoritolerans TaxID=450367 RepID=UPI001E37261B
NALKLRRRPTITVEAPPDKYSGNRKKDRLKHLSFFTFQSLHQDWFVATVFKMIYPPLSAKTDGFSK